ncbi:MAG: TrkH family potassium uptake protein [Planctomycetota bacterium]
MNLESLLHALGRIFSMLGLLFGAPLALALLDEGLGGPHVQAFLVSGAVSLCLGWALRLSFPWEPLGFGVSEALATMSLGWVGGAALSALPFLLSGAITSPLDAGFEALSGLTTTGATILTDPQVLPRSLLAWRAMLHWCGGLATLAMVLAFLPAFGAGGSLVPGDTPELLGRERPLLRLASVVRRLWPVYALFTVLLAGAFFLTGMSVFEAACHAMSVSATGGFGTRADGLASFAAATGWVAAAGMMLAGLSLFGLRALLSGRLGLVLRGAETRTYLILLVALAACCLLATPRGAPLEPRLRDAVLTAASTLSTTGLVNAGLVGVPDAQLSATGPLLSSAVLRLLLLVALVIGACSGSTGGGFKVGRMLLMARFTRRETARLLRPAAVFVVKLGGRPVPEQVLLGCGIVLLLHLAVAFVAALALLLLGCSLETSWSAALSALSNYGNAHVGLGSPVTWSEVAPLAKLVAMACMLLGRLEFHAVLVLLLPLAWKR